MAKSSGRFSSRAAALVLAALCGCASPGPMAPDVLVDPIQIDSVDVLVSSAPATVAAHVRGIVGDGCSTLRSVSQTRSGSAITITILRERPRAAICSQIARLFDETIALDGPFPSGRYVVRVNAFEQGFTIE